MKFPLWKAYNGKGFLEKQEWYCDMYLLKKFIGVVYYVAVPLKF